MRGWMVDMRLLGWLRSAPEDDSDELVGHEEDAELEAVPIGEVPYPLAEGEPQDVV